MVTLELQYFEVMDRDFTAIEARIFVGGVCARLLRNFDANGCQQERYGNQAEHFEFADDSAALSFIKSNRAYKEFPPDRP